MSADAVMSVQSLIGGMRSVDLAPLIEEGMPVWPLHPHLNIDQSRTHGGNGYYCQTISMAEHTGCHCDVPAHMHQDKMSVTVETLPADILVTTARVYDFSARKMRPGECLTRQDILDYEAAHGAPVGANEIALINFGWMANYWHNDERAKHFVDNEPGMDEGVATLFRERGVRAVGSDTIACDTVVVDGKVGEAPGHNKHWLPNGILILECVARLELLPRSCFFFAAPLPIKNGSGSPLRPLAFF